jgi:hypothetical protein
VVLVERDRQVVLHVQRAQMIGAEHFGSLSSASIPGGLDILVMKLLSQNPAARYSSRRISSLLR